MNKKLTAKPQKLSPKIPDNAQSFSNAFSVDPDDEEMLERKGSLHVTFDVSSGVTFDTLLVTKVVHDLLHNSYYQSESVSPIQSLEKAVVDVRDRVAGMAKEADKSGDTKVSFNIVACVLWGNVLYIVQYGKGGSFLVRDGEVKNVNSASEGHFSVASGVVKDDDVVILGTSKFLENHPPDALINKASEVSSYDLNLMASAILLKFEINTSFSQDEVIDFGLEEKKEPEIKSSVQTLADKESSRIVPGKPLFVGFPKKLGLKLRPERGQRVKVPFTLVIVAIALLFGASVLFTLRGGGGEESKGMLSGAISFVNNILGGSGDDENSLDQEQPAGAGSEDEVQDDRSMDEQNKVTRVGNDAFYDIKITDESASPTDIVLVDNLAVVVDSTSGKVFTSGLETPQFEAEDVQFAGIKNPVYFGGDVAFADNEGYKVYAPSSDEVVESYAQEGLGITSAYLEFVYELTGDKITKYEKSDDTLEGSLWGQSGEFENGVSMAIDGSIFVLKSDGGLVSFTSGEQDEFSVSGLDKGFSAPVEIVTSIDMENLYIADKGNKRVVVLDKDGEFVRQYITEDQNVWNDIKGVAVLQDESKMYVLSGSKVFEVFLESSEPDAAEETPSE